jgi:hypothetical protein
LMRLLAIVCITVLGSVPVVSGAQVLDARTTLRSLPSERPFSLVLTAQGAEHLTPPARSESPLSLRSEWEAPSGSRVQSLALLLPAQIACAAMGTSCALTPPARTSITPPGSGSWQRVGCKTPQACGWPRDPRD